MENYWMFIINQENWEIVRSKNIIGSNNINKLKIIKENDYVVVYVKKPVSSLTGILKVISNYVDRKSLFKGGNYPYRLKLSPIKILDNPINIKTILNELNFIKIKINGLHTFLVLKV